METLPVVLFPEQVEELLMLTEISNQFFWAGRYTDGLAKVFLRQYLSLRLKGIDHRDAVDIVTFDVKKIANSLTNGENNSTDDRGRRIADSGNQLNSGATPGD